MNEAVRKMVALAGEVGRVFVATADNVGTPHLAVAGRMEIDGQGAVAVSAWFCPATMENVQKNPKISLVTWDSEADEGHQLIGEVVGTKEIAFLNGYAPALEDTMPLPQVERRLIVRATKIIRFSHAPHSDVEE